MLVSTLPLQKIYLRRISEGYGKSEIARNCGYYRHDKQHPKSGDVERLHRTLGLSPYNSNGKYIFRKQVTMNVAVLLLGALHADPVDAGI